MRNIIVCIVSLTMLLFTSCGRKQTAYYTSDMDTAAVAEEAVPEEVGIEKAYMITKDDSIILYVNVHTSGYSETKFRVVANILFNDDYFKDDPYLKDNNRKPIEKRNTLNVHSPEPWTTKLRFAINVDDCNFCVADFYYHWDIKLYIEDASGNYTDTSISERVDFKACMGGVVEYTAYDEDGNSIVQHPALIHPELLSSERGKPADDSESSSEAQPTEAVCPACHGTGQIMCSVCGVGGSNIRYSHGSIVANTCRACNGAGFILCAGCGGVGTIFYR